ncbi:MAG: SDR family oxidoreductase [Myxococcota bacterium]|jgi:hypothetical protein
MKTAVDLKGKLAIVTGASAGLGVAFAEQLASMGANLVITARRADRLEKLAADLSHKHGVSVKPVSFDLETPGAARDIYMLTEGVGEHVEVLVNNAGFASFSPFCDTPWDRLAGQLRVNVMALTELTHLFLKPMVGRKGGYVLNVSSYASYMPVPYYAVYSSSKAYVRNFTEALAYELKDTGVHICSLCPGMVSTEFWEVSGQGGPPKLFKHNVDTPGTVAKKGLDALFAGKTNTVPGGINAFSAWMTRFGPVSVVSSIAAWAAGDVKKEWKP